MNFFYPSFLGRNMRRFLYIQIVLVGPTNLWKPLMTRLKRAAALSLVACVALTACAGSHNRGPKRPELSPERKAELYERFVVRWDENGDGGVSCADIEIRRDALFTELDTDTDNLLASVEYRYAKFEDKSFLFHLFADVDSDASGSISRDELHSVSDSLFASLDKDGNCIVSREEAATAAQKQARDERGKDSEDRGGREGREGGRGPRGQRPVGFTNFIG